MSLTHQHKPTVVNFSCTEGCKRTWTCS